MSDSSDAQYEKKISDDSIDAGQLLVRHRDGCPNAFPEIIKLFRARVYSYIIRCAVAPAVRDDLFQEIFIKVHRSAHTYNSELRLEPWLFTIVANSVRTHFSKKNTASDNESGALMSIDTVEKFTGEDIANAQQTADWLLNAIAKLPLNQREVLVMHCLKNMEQREVAQALGIPVNTIKTNLRRARASLAKALARRNSQHLREVTS